MRQFIASEQLKENTIIAISEKEVHYLKNVLRLKPGESIDVRLLDGSLLEMSLVKKNTKWLLQKVLGAKKKENGVLANQLDTEDLEIHLLQCEIKPQKMDLVIRQATECGVKKIVPILGDFSQGISTEKKHERWLKIIKEARQQSGSAIATELAEKMTFDEYLAKEEKNVESIKKKLAFKCYLSENKRDDSLFSLLMKKGKPDIIHIAVGCEGGISKREAELLEKSGFSPLHLLTNILRSETAALYGLAVLQNAVMEYHSWQRQE